MTDARTIAVYDARASDYAELGSGKPWGSLTDFIAALPQGGDVLDLGCGPGTAALHMQAAGLAVDAIDASGAMVDLACKRGIAARKATFDDVTQSAAYDGIWANFSLLHAAPVALPRHIAAIARALRPGGLFHIAMKSGTGQHRDALDRLYTYVTRSELTDLLTQAGMTPFCIRTGVDKGLAGTDDAFIVIQARKTADA